ncbi:hypothetical protein RRG08_033425 [Elysia crispata]|uniref:Uncharacterized protein n=1 Tax=Elysia crispata TaxID=231223 RepID=A0AAE1AU20_9GAST|nr:hypothetical protein RRG08_033425 [Elysia crispata]
MKHTPFILLRALPPPPLPSPKDTPFCSGRTIKPEHQTRVSASEVQSNVAINFCPEARKQTNPQPKRIKQLVWAAPILRANFRLTNFNFTAGDPAQGRQGLGVCRRNRGIVTNGVGMFQQDGGFSCPPDLANKIKVTGGNARFHLSSSTLVQSEPFSFFLSSTIDMCSNFPLKIAGQETLELFGECGRSLFLPNKITPLGDVAHSNLIQRSCTPGATEYLCVQFWTPRLTGTSQTWGRANRNECVELRVSRSNTRADNTTQSVCL